MKDKMKGCSWKALFQSKKDGRHWLVDATFACTCTESAYFDPEIPIMQRPYFGINMKNIKKTWENEVDLKL